MEKIWTIWLFAILGSFILIEGYAIYTHTMTLTAWTRVMTDRFPILPWFWGFSVIVLACHFWLETR